jgi:hypothetical protein
LAAFELTPEALWLRLNDVGIEFIESEWNILRELFQKALAIPDIQLWLQELHNEYGEQVGWGEWSVFAAFFEEQCLRHRELNGHAFSENSAPKGGASPIRISSYSEYRVE